MVKTLTNIFDTVEVEIAPLADDLKLIFDANIYEDEKSTVPANHIVYSGETYYIKLQWMLVGKLAPHFSGEWLVKVDLESIGTAKEYSSELYTIPMDPCQKDWYEKVFPLTPGTVNPAEGGTVYLVAVTLSSLDPCGQPGHIFAYAEGASVMFVRGEAP